MDSVVIERIPYITITIGTKEKELAAGRLICSIKPRWALKKLAFKRLATDEHSVYYVVNLKDNEDDQNSVLLKIYSTNSDVYTDHEEQFHLLTHLMDEAIAPQLLLRFANGYLCQHISGKPLDIKDQLAPELIARKLSEFHSIPSRFHGSRLADKLKRFIDLFVDKDKALHDRLIEIHSEREKLSTPRKSLVNSLKSVIGLSSTPNSPLTFAQLQARLKDISWTELSKDVDGIWSALEKNWALFDIPIVLCLNNVRLSNFMYDAENRSLSIVDFDHCLHDYYLIDIVSYFLELAGEDYEKKYPERHVQKQFLAEYLKNSTLNMANTVYDHRTPADHELEHLCDLCGLLIAPIHLYWALWAFLQALLTKPTSAFDYVNYGRIRLAQYYRHKGNFFLPVDPAKKTRPKF